MPRRTDRIIPFRPSTIDAIVLPAKGHVEWWDESTPNLAIRVSSTGFKSFVWIGRHGKEFKRVGVGPYPATTVTRARDAAKILTAKSIAGEIPTTKAKTLREEWTLGELFEWYLETVSKPHKKTWKLDKQRFDRVLDPWARRRVSSIERGDVQRLHIELNEAKGPCAANKMLELLSHMYKQGKIFHPLKVACDSPTFGVARFPKHERERFLDSDELPRFLAAVLELRLQISRDFLLMCLWTGARRGAVSLMRWEEISLSECVWNVPRTSSKNKRPLQIVLSPPAVEILRRRKNEVTGQWVFPGNGEGGRYKDPRDAWDRVRKLSGIKNIRMHDLRRTLGSWMAVDQPLQVIGKQLGHNSQKSTAIYARLANRTQKKAVGDTTEKMLQAGKKRAKD